MTEFEEIQAAITALAKEMGEKASVHISLKGCSLMAWAAPSPVYNPKEHIFARDHNGDWRKALDSLRTQWAERSGAREAQVIQAMALAIVRLTYETGGCTDAQLRGDFDAADVVRYGAQAVERANAMADKGPFSITTTKGVNW